jgi:hypothetical protein
MLASSFCDCACNEKISFKLVGNFEGRIILNETATYRALSRFTHANRGHKIETFHVSTIMPTAATKLKHSTFQNPTTSSMKKQDMAHFRGSIMPPTRKIETFHV